MTESTRRWSMAIAMATLIAGGAVGCTGSIGARASRSGTGAGVGTVTGSGAGTGTGGQGNIGGGLAPVPVGVFVPAPASLRRLTIPQYANSIHDLFGQAVTVPADFEEDTRLAGFASIGAAIASLSPHITEQFETASLAIAKQVLSDTGRRAALAGCTPAATTDDVCTRQFLQRTGRRVWRRALTDEELGRYGAIARNAQTVLGNFFGGLEYGLAGLLQSPHFIYRVELGAPDAKDPARVVFDDDALATRLSFFLWNTTPDDALLDAADARQLATGDGLLAQTQRLLASTRVSAAMQTYFTELYRLEELDALPQLPSLFPLMTTTLGASMRAETLRFLDDIAFGRGADYRDIFDSRATFVNAELAKVYGVSGITGSSPVPVTLADSGMRAGLLGQGSFLAIHSGSSRGSPTRRGKFIREMLLCQGIPAAPPGVEPLPENGTGTAKQKLEVHRSVDACRACHLAMDPIGLGLENFDGIGAFRTMDAGQTIDPSGDLDGVAFAGPRELAVAIRNHPASGPCVARTVFRYALGHVETAGEEAAIKLLAQAFTDGNYRFPSLLAGVVANPAFLYAAKAQ